MTEITFKISHSEDKLVVTIYEDGKMQQIHSYHKETNEGIAVIQTAADWYGHCIDIQ